MGQILRQILGVKRDSRLLGPITCVAAARDGPIQLIDVTSCKSAGVRVLTSMGRPTTAACIRDTHSWTRRVTLTSTPSWS
jgi:hypothetical protein